MAYIKHQILRAAGNVAQNMAPKIIGLRFREMTRLHANQSFLHIDEFRIFDISGNKVDLSAATASASSSQSASFLPGNAIDENPSTDWLNANSAFPADFMIALENPISISRVEIEHGASDTGPIPRAPGSFFIDVMPRGQTVWVQVESYTGLTSDDYLGERDGFFDVNYAG